MAKLKCKDHFDALRKITDLVSNLTTPAQIDMALEILAQRKVALTAPEVPAPDEAA